MSDFISFRETPIHFRTTGAGPWVVLLHGFIESLEIWDGFAAMLEKDFSVLMVDLPGHGRSGVVDLVHSMDLMAECVLEITDHLRIDSFTVCGHSMGGYVSLKIAETRPQQVKGVVLFHSHAAPDDETARENRLRTIKIVQQNRSGFIHQFIPDLFAEESKKRLVIEIESLTNRAASTSGKSVVAALYGMMERRGGFDFLMSTPLPVLFVIGKNDDRMPYQKLLAQAMLPAHAEILLLDKVGHMGFMEAPEKTFPVIRDFFRRSQRKNNE
ncbi:MAG: alpha/beta hydrolase [Bacteroidales bacterium]|nr:alpha/beta hydrolase [Bacteroidales bacterium]